MGVLLLVMAAVPFTAFSKIKSDRVKPAWVKNTPQALNDTYSFKVVSVDNGQDLSSSQLLARAEYSDLRGVAKRVQYEYFRWKYK